MKNITSIITGTATAAVLILANIGCQTTASSNIGNAGAANSNTVARANTTVVPVAPDDDAPAARVGSLATPSDAYRTAYDLRKQKDVAGLKKIMSPDITEFLTMMAEAETKTLDDLVNEMCDKPQADRVEVRNEKISGDIATVEYLTETGAWKTVDFEKINGEWRLTLPKADGPEKGIKNTM